MKHWTIWIIVAVALAIIGCGGGGGGGSTTSTTSTTSTNGTNGITQGLTGHVRNVNLTPIANARIKFYSNAGVELAQTVTDANGDFEAQLPVSAKRFTVDFSQIADAQNYFHQYGYGDYEYLENDPGCTAKAPNFTSGQVKSLQTDIVITQLWFGPPSPPDGCISG